MDASNHQPSIDLGSFLIIAPNPHHNCVPLAKMMRFPLVLACVSAVSANYGAVQQQQYARPRQERQAAYFQPSHQHMVVMEARPGAYPKPAGYIPPVYTSSYNNYGGSYQDPGTTTETGTWWLLAIAGVACAICVMIAGGCLCNQFIIIPARKARQEKMKAVSLALTPQSTVLSQEQLAVI
jgi:hypothetical protein